MSRSQDTTYPSNMLRRLTRECQLAKSQSSFNVTIDDQNIRFWQVVLTAPSGTLYEGEVFLIELLFPENYPFSPPASICLSGVEHPNIDPLGKICHEILNTGWNAGYNGLAIITCIYDLICNPDFENPAQPTVSVQSPPESSSRTTGS